MTTRHSPKGKQQPRKRQRREPLSRERIELAALQLIDEVGLDAFSTRRLGDALGCEAMSIYHHFPSKAHLLDALVDRIVATAHVPPRELPPPQRLRELMRGWRRMALSHPRFYPMLSVHRMNSATGLRYLDEVMHAFHDACPDRERAARLFRAFGYFLMGAALDEISGYAQGPSSMNPVGGEDFAARFPHIAEAGAFFSPAHFERTFELGIDLLLAGAGLLPSDAGSTKGRTATRGKKQARARR